MRVNIARLFFFVYFSSLSAMLVGNPAQPGMLEKGIQLPGYWCSFRFGYLDDWIYKERFQDEFNEEGLPPMRTSARMSTYAGLLTLNFANRLDIYGIIGSCRVQIDEELFTKRALGWGIGGKLVILQAGNFYLSTDAKYFETSQKPRYFVIDGAPYNIISAYELKYTEVQVAVGFSYVTSLFSPYLNGTYISAKIAPQPNQTLVRLPDENEVAVTSTGTVSNRDHWGVALGLTLIDCAKASLSCEWRGFNQNAVNVNAEVRF